MVFIIQKGTTRKKLDAFLKNIKEKKGVNAKKYCGVIKLKENPLDIQKKMRDEWE